MMNHSMVCAVVLAFAPVGLATEPEPDRWQQAMDQFAVDDAKRGEAPAEIVFVGSSTIRMWELAKSFPKVTPTPLNRGFGGSQFSDIVRHIDRLVLRHKPKLVVVYSGDNDLASGKEVATVVSDFHKIVASIHEAQPDTRIVVLAPKPSVQRWEMRAKFRELNKSLAAQCGDDDKLTWLDTWPATLNQQGEPDATLFRDDGLHLNDKGYAKWAELVRGELTLE